MGPYSILSTSQLSGVPLSLAGAAPLVETHIAHHLDGAIAILQQDWGLARTESFTDFQQLINPLTRLDRSVLHPETDGSRIEQNAEMSLQLAENLHQVECATEDTAYQSRLLMTTLQAARESLAEEAVQTSPQTDLAPHSLSFMTDRLSVRRMSDSVDGITETLKRQGFPEPFTDVLIWNSALAMTRLVGGVRSFSQRATGDKDAIRVITVSSDGDKEAAYRSSGDVQIAIRGRTAAETYNDLEKYRETLREAKKIAANRGKAAKLAVMVGWGYIAERPEAYQIAVEEGVVFIGPDAENIINHGDKAQAKAMAERAGVPTIRGRNVESATEAREVAAEIAYPVMLKARHGGGGRGIRPVETADRIESEFETARREAEQAFGSGELLMEKKLVGCRHIEFQFAADTHGNAVVVGERDCTAQRKNQKVIESGASETVPLEERLPIRRAVEELVRQSGYCNVGTAEFLYDPEAHAFYFLEVNTRLQVEHGVTEAERGIDLVSVQLAVAMGARLDKIFSPLQLWRFRNSDPDRFTLAVRIIAEDGWTGTGSTGKITELTVPHDLEELRQYFSVKSGSRVTGLADPQIGHLYVTAPTRRDAVAIMLRALALVKIQGIQTNIPFLQDLLESPEFTANAFDNKFIETAFIPQHQEHLDRKAYPEVALIAQAIKIYESRMETLRREYEDALETGQPLPALSRHQLVEIKYEGHRYHFAVEGDNAQSYRLSLMQADRSFATPIRVIWEERPRAERQLKIGRDYFIVAYGDDSVAVNGAEALTFTAKDPTRIRSAFEGKVLSVLVQDGQNVEAGQALYLMEAMKMEHTISAEHAGIVGEVHVTAGQQVKQNELIMEFQPEGVQETQGERIEEWPRSGRERYQLRPLADLLFQGIQLNPAIVRNTLKAAADDEKVNDFVADLTHIISQFWQREKNALEKPELSTAWDHQLTRETLDAQVTFVEDLLSSLLGINIRKLPESLQNEVMQLLEELSSFNVESAAHSPIAIKARFLLDRVRPATEIDVSGVLEHLSTEDPAITNGAIEQLERVPQSLAGSIIPLLSHDETRVRQHAATLLLRRTYSAYHLRSVSIGEIADSLTFSFTDSTRGPVRHGVGLLVKPQPAETGQALAAQFKEPLQLAHRALVRSRTGDDIDNDMSSPFADDVIEMTARLVGAFDRHEWVTALEHVLNETIVTNHPRRVTLTLVDDRSSQPFFQTFRPDPTTGRWSIDHVMENFHPIDGETLELYRFEGFELQKLHANNSHVHLFAADAADDRLLTSRVAIPFTQIEPTSDGPQLPEAEHAFADALASLTQFLTAEHGRDKQYTHNNLFVSVEGIVALEFEEIEPIVRRIAERHRNEFGIAQVRTAEIALRVRDAADREERGFKDIRVALKNPAGDGVIVRIAVEVTDPNSKQKVLVPLEQFLSKRRDDSYVIPRNLIQQLDPYRPLTPLQRRRDKQEQRGNTYVYDMPGVLRERLAQIWLASRKSMPEDALTFEEVILEDANDESQGLQTVDRRAGENDLSVVVWKMRVLFPGEAEPREFVLGANDTTVDNGSMDLPDDRLYTAAVRYAVQEGIPFIFGFSGSGARMFPHEEVGRRALYDADHDRLLLSPEDFAELSAEQVLLADDVEYKKRPMKALRGVEAKVNQSALLGSGLMIEASAAASEQVPTLGLAIGSAAVGKQAYAYRLLSRTIQLKRNAVLLTGKGPINAGIGRNAYSDNRQIGGYRVHAGSGVSHQVANDIGGGMDQALEWLRFQTRRVGIAAHASGQLPAIHVNGPRRLTPQQVRKMRDQFEDWDVAARLLNGPDPVIRLDESGKVVPYDPRDIAESLFDQGSFVEAQANYAPNVVVGRARLGGLTVGTILFETRTTEVIRPADPAKPMKMGQRTSHHAGRVWDSAGAYKTAEWIEAIGWEGHPMVMMPNIRGFLGDPTSLYEDIIKHGADIVRKVRAFRQPFIIWMPPYAELRGGAWVVIDPRINSEWIRFYVDPQATLGVLEPEMMLSLSHVKRALIMDAADMGDDSARKKWLKLFRLSDSPEIAVHQGQLHGVVPTSNARRQIFDAIVEKLEQS